MSWFKVVSVIAVMVLPLIYGFLYLWAFWDPYAALKNVPIAVVNLDKGATHKDEKYNLGNKLVDKLKDNTALGWRFVDQEAAEKGLQNKTYYSIVTIPENFSANALSADGDSPKEANILLTSRQASSFMAGKFSETAMTKLVSELNKEVEEEYWKNVYVSMRSIGNDLGKAIDGANKLQNGLSDMSDGNKKITDGLNDAESGNRTLDNGLNDLKNGSNDLKNGLNDASTGSAALASGIGSINSGLNTFTQSLSSLQTGVAQVQGGVTSSKAGVDQAIALLDDQNNIPTVKAILTGVSSGLGTVNGGITAINTGVQTAGVGLTQLSGGTSTSLSSANQLSSGISTLYNGSVSLDSGLQTAKDGANNLHDGLLKLIDGSKDLDDGITKAKDGAKTLADDLAKGKDKVLKESSQKNEDKQVPVLSAPVAYESSPIASVANNGTGFAPYFIPLALWVGAMAIYFIIENPHFEPKQIITFAAIGVGQAILLDFSLMHFLGMQVLDIKAFMLFTIALSWCYMTIQSLINHFLKEAGKFVNILLLMLQITSSAGSYPLETSPAFFQKIHAFLPMTYAVNVYREIISGGNFVYAFSQARVIVEIGCAFFVVNAVREVVRIKYAKNAKKN